NDEHTKKIFEQERLIKEGNNLVEQGHYTEGIVKYNEAMNPDLLLHDYDIARPVLLTADALKFNGQYEDALNQVKRLKECPEMPSGQLPSPSCYEKLELEALIKARDTNSTQSIYDYISYLEKKYKKILPPQMCVGWCDAVFATIARLYDHIGDYDEGIEFTDRFLQFYKKIGPGDPYQPANPHFQVKQAFLQEKTEGGTGCVAAKPGEACMGRATKALIQSDYFPW
ncbi:MAG TPA: hypothetical protein VL688_06130, partial [Verrucomicrobiae bacterium]|nr:hypothetical protein [Verrucomicrobiae bacterium]